MDERKPGLLKVYASPKMAWITLLGFASGLPLLLTSKTLQAWLSSAKVDLTTIGLFSLVATPYSLKFLWSPLIDRYRLPWLGRRRGWMAVAQVALALALTALALSDPRSALRGVAIVALLIAFLSATLDIANDAYRVDMLAPAERGAGVAVYVLGYRIAMLLAGSAAFVLADRMGWGKVYGLMAAAMLLTVGATLGAPEPQGAAATAPASMREAVVEPFHDFFAGAPGRAAIMLLFVAIYRLADSLAGNMAIPFLLQTGFTQTEVGVVQGGVGLLATIVGAFFGGGLLARLGVNRSLWVFGVLAIVSNVGYLLLAQRPSHLMLIGCIVVENFCSGLVLAGMQAFYMSLCSPKYSATQFALLTSLWALSRDVLVAPAGKIAAAAGWPGFFWITIAAGVPGMLLLPFFAPWNRELPLGARQSASAAAASAEA